MAKALIRPDGGASVRALAGQRTGRICPAQRPRPGGAMKAPCRFCGFLSLRQG